MKKIAYCGIEGAFAHAAARKMFPDALHVSCKSFKEAYETVLSGECEMAVLPIENSYAGKVAEVVEILSEGKVSINTELSLPIVQNLLGVRGSRKGDIKKVISHIKALEQCDEYIAKKGYEVEVAVNTAVAARQVARMQKISVGAIASLEVAAMYGLKVLEENINVKEDNTTRFIAVEAM